MAALVGHEEPVLIVTGTIGHLHHQLGAAVLDWALRKAVKRFILELCQTIGQRSVDALRRAVGQRSVDEAHELLFSNTFREIRTYYRPISGYRNKRQHPHVSILFGNN